MTIPLRMQWIILSTAVALGCEGLGSAFIGPGADLGIITAAWVAMIVALARQAGVALERHTATKIASAILVAVGSAAGGAKLAAHAFAWTGVGTLPAMVANGGINAVITYLTGRTIAITFLRERRVDSVEDFTRGVVAALFATFGVSDHGSHPTA